VWYGRTMVHTLFTCRRLIHLDYRRSILFKSPCAVPPFAASSK
jgi:hypothetical protein